DRFYNAPDTEIDFTEQGGLMWGEHAVGRLEKGAEAMRPGVVAFVDEEAGSEVSEKVQRRLQHFIDRRVATLFEPLLAMQRDEALTGMARGFAFQLIEGLGVLPREGQVASDVKALDQADRGLLRKHGVRFGQFTVFMPLLLKPAPTRLRLVLWSLWQGLDEFPESPPPGLVTIPTPVDAPRGYAGVSGYRGAGARSIRIDMLERLADQIRAEDTRAGFEAKADMLSITGMTLEQFADLMQGLGYKAERAERPKAKKPPAPEPEAPAAGMPAAVAPSDAEGADASAAGALAAPDGIDATAAADGAGAADANVPTPDEVVGTPVLDSTVAEAPMASDTPEIPETPSEVPDTPSEVPVAPEPEVPAEPVPESPPMPSEVPDAPPPPEVSEAAGEAEVDAVAAPAVADEQAPDQAGTAASGDDEDSAEVEVYYTFTWAPRRKSGGGPRRARPESDGAARPKGGKRPPKGAKGGKPRGKPGPRDQNAKTYQARPPRTREKEIDPDNPFAAALMGLKDKS
ncbi:MAG: hypothetical protein AAGG09_07950, partial [Pseudomonadota bacterium]